MPLDGELKKVINLVPFASMKMVTQVFKDERTVFRNSVDWFLEVLEPKMLSKILDGRIANCYGDVVSL
jgi:hypothetical protein